MSKFVAVKATTSESLRDGIVLSTPVHCRIRDGVQPLELARVEQLGFMIFNGKAGPFRLETHWFRPYGKGPDCGPIGEALQQGRSLSSAAGAVR